MSRPRSLAVVAALAAVAALGGCAGDRTSAAFPFTGTWIQVRSTSPDGERVLDSAQIGVVSVTADQVVVALAGERRVVAVPVSATGSDGASCGSLDLGDGQRVIVTAGEGMVERSVEGVRLGMPARYLDIEVAAPPAMGQAIHARVWSAAELRPPVVIAVERPRAAAAIEPSAAPVPSAPVAAAAAPPAAVPMDADSAFIAGSSQDEPELSHAAAAIVLLAREHGVRSDEVMRERWRDADLVRRRQLELLMEARVASGQAAQALLRDAARLERAVALFEAAYSAWSDARG
jgi:hypothetical protein